MGIAITMDVAGAPVAVGAIEDGVLTLIIGVRLSSILGLLLALVAIVAIGMAVVRGTIVAMGAVEDGILFGLVRLVIQTLGSASIQLILYCLFSVCCNRNKSCDESGLEHLIEYLFFNLL